MTEFNALTDGSRMSEEEVNSKLELLPENVYDAIKDRLDEIPFEIRLALAFPWTPPCPLPERKHVRKPWRICAKWMTRNWPKK